MKTVDNCRHSPRHQRDHRTRLPQRLGQNTRRVSLFLLTGESGDSEYESQWVLASWRRTALAQGIIACSSCGPSGGVLALDNRAKLDDTRAR
jgi:hypothetical protein